MALDLVPLGTLTIKSTSPIMLPGIPHGTRIIGVADGCRWEGERVTASQTGGAATDWLLIAPDGTATLDARMTLLTDDGAVICVTYTGRADLSGASSGAIVATPRFETNDERYAWLNKVQAIAKGERVGEEIVYELYEVR